MNRWGSRRGMEQRSRPALVIYLVLLLAISSLTFLAPVGADAAHATTTGRIIVVSNETAIPIAIGTPSTGLDPFPGLLSNHVGIHVTGQLVDGNYTPIWQPGSVNNHGIPHSYVQWSFGNEADRAHSMTTDGDGYFTFFLTPEVTAPSTEEIRFWFDGKALNIFGISIYPPAEVVYEVKLVETNHLTVEPVQSRAMVGDMVLVQGSFSEIDGTPIANEGLMAFFDDASAQDNPHDGWYIDNIVLGPFDEDFEDGMSFGFESGGQGSTWSSGIPKAGPRGGYQSLRSAGTALDSGYEYATDSWLMSPVIDLSLYNNVVLSFESWLDIDDDDTVLMEISNDNGVTWPVSMEVQTTPSQWSQFTVQVGKFYDTPYGDVDFAYKDQVRLRFRLKSYALPIETDDQGRYEFMFTIPEDKPAGPYSIKVEHPGSSRYIRTTSSVDIRIARFTGIETVEMDTIYNGIPVEIRARLLDTDGTDLETHFNGFPTQMPQVRILLRQGMEETHLGEMQVDRDGYVALGKVFPRTGPLGSAEIVFSFKGNEFYGPSEAIHDVAFKAHTKTNIISPNDASLMSGDEIEISGTVHVVRTESVNDVTQDPVIRRDVTVLMNGNEIGTTTTNEEGAFTLVYDIKGSGDNLGNAAITAQFLGDLVYEPSEDTVDFSILSETTLQVTPRVMKKGSLTVIDGTLTSIEGGLHGIVDIQVGDDHFKKMVTGSSGRFATTYSVPWELDVGPIPVTVTYHGNDVYKSSTTTVMFTVEADTMIRVDDGFPVKAYRGNSVALKGTLVDTWDGAIGPPVLGNIIEMTLPDGTKAQALTGLNGKFNYHYQLPADLSIGETEVVLTFTGVHRSPSTACIPIEVVSSTQLEFIEIKDNVHTGEVTAIKVRLMDDAGEPLSGEMVKVFLVEDGREVPIYQGPTDSSGTVAFTTHFNVTGTLSVVARFDGSDHLDPSERYSYTMSKTAPAVRPPLREQPEVVLGGGLFTILVIALIGTESGKYFLFKLLLVPMYTKLKKTDVLDHFVRGQIYGLIRMHPGAHYNQIKKKLDLKNGVLSYHLKTLEREGYVLSEIDGIYKRFFPNHVKFEVDFPIFLSKIQERILDFIKAKPGSTQKEMAKDLGVSTSTVNDNIRVLCQVKLIEMKRDGKRTKCYAAEG